MASFSTTEVNSTIPEIWDRTIEQARYAKPSIMKAVSNKSALVSGPGDRVHVSIKAKLSAGTVGSNGAFTASCYNATTATVIINQFKYVACDVEMIAKTQSFWDPNSDFAKDTAQAMNNDVDAYLGSLINSTTMLDIVGSIDSPTAYNKDMLVTSLLKLVEANCPIEDITAVLPPIAYFRGILNETQFTDADKTGAGKSPLLTGSMPMPLAVPILLSVNLTKVADKAWAGAVLHKSALACAIQKNLKYFSFDKLAAGYFIDSKAVLSMYGAVDVRSSDSAVKVYVSTSA